MNVIWFSNVDISATSMSGSGTWVMAMARAICCHDKNIAITNISMAETGSDVKLDGVNIRQINIKTKSLNNELISRVNRYIHDINPSVLHVWGTESLWSSFPFSREIPVLIDIQGIMSSVYENVYGGLSTSERVRCWGLKECLKPTSSIQYIKHIYKNLISREHNVISALDFVSVQSAWVEGYIRAINKNCKIFKTGIALRPEFYASDCWQNSSAPILFSTATMVTPLKGLHTLIKALAIIKTYYPNVQLRLAGEVQSGIRVGGYAKLLRSLMKRYDLLENITFLGQLKTQDLIEEYKNAAIVINPSSIESYSLVVAEAMHIGAPVVASYVGGMAELGSDNESICYFPKEDYVSCARKVIELLDNSVLREKISINAIKRSRDRDDLANIANRQLSIYNEILFKI